MAKQKSKGQTWLEYLLAVALLTTLRRLPLPAANAVAGWAARLLDRLLPKLRRVARINLGFAMPELTSVAREELIDGVFCTIARLLVALARFPSLNQQNIDSWIAYEGLENYLAAKQMGRGVLVATAHLGNWELSAFAHAILSEPMNVMVRALDNPLIDQIVEDRRAASGNRLVYKQDAARAVLRALRDNEAVGILIDQNTTPAEGAFIRFFGQMACAGTGFVKLAQRSGAVIIPGFALWEEKAGKYVLRFYPPIELTADAIADTQRIHLFFETVIREYPDQWMWIHRRWKTRPPGEPALY